MKATSLITVFLVLLFKFGDAQSWIYVTNAADDSKIYISSNPVYLAYTIKVWVRTTEGNIINDEDGVQVKIREGNTICLIEFDCRNQQYRIHTLVYLDANGKVQDSFDLRGYQSTWLKVLPDSVYEKVLKKVCEFFS